jgi:hypothetical protein
VNDDELKGTGRKRSWPNFKVVSRHFPGGAEGNHEKSQSLWPVSGPRFEPGTSRIRSRSVNHLTMTLGVFSCSDNDYNQKKSLLFDINRICSVM